MRAKEKGDDDASALNAYGCELVQYGRTKEAERAFRAAAALGEIHAMYNLGLLTERTGRIGEAKEWYVRAHQAGHLEAANNLGCLLFNADDPLAVSWFEIAAEAGHPQAVQNLRVLTARPALSRVNDPVLRPMVLDRQAADAYEAFTMTGVDASLVRAVNLSRQAVLTASADHPARHLLLTHLRDVLWRRYDLRGHDTDLEEAVSVALDAWRALPEDAAERVAAARAAIELLRNQCELTRDSDLLGSELNAARRELSRDEGDEEERARLSSALCGALACLAQHTDTDVDLDEAVALGQAAVQLLPAECAALVNFGAALLHRGRQKGNVEDIDAAVTALGRAMETDAGSARTVAAMNLTTALRTRAELTGRQEDDRRARVVAAEVSAALAEGDSVSPRALLHAALVADGVLALDAVRRALSALPETHAARPVLLTQLATELHRAGEQGEAVTAAREAVRTASVKPVEVGARYVLGSALLAGPEEGVAPGDAAVAEAIEMLAAAAKACERTAIEYADVLVKYASALLLRFESRAAQADLTDALEKLRAAAGATHSPLSDRLSAARLWSGVARETGDTADALAGARIAVSLLQEFGWMGLDRADQEEGLHSGAAMPREAAALAIINEQPELAVELLEQGRSVLWRSTMHLRGDLSLLTEKESALAEELERIRTQLHTTGQVDPDLRVVLARRWSKLLERVRSKTDFKTFLKPPPFATLVQAAAEGPVVIVNISTIRCDALVVRPDGQVEVVPLPGVTVLEMDRVANRYVAHLAAAEERDATVVQRERARHTVHDTLEWLWEHIAEPVLDRLALDGADLLPRVWWCPTASLTLLPLHAAGRYPRGGGDTPPSVGVPYQVVSSYTTSLSSLVDARRPHTTTAPGLLAIAVTDTGRGHTPLPGVDVELEALRECFAGRRLKVLTDDECTLGAVRTYLPAYPWTHFACHGKLDMTEPSTSGLCLSDDDMNVLDFANLPLEEAELAFLSACLTHVGSSLLPDEAIHTAAALRMAGFRHVVATLWSIHDQAAPRVAAAFYRHLLTEDADVSGTATALHRAVAELRAEYPDDPTVWAPFAHNGP
ncbi:CHAT domain-containing protein [Streptomyces massasporeus]|uniref:CHAT domain-containing protein n=2 Tax=Streptomyces TaxID=1883 RepID=UPI00372264DB